MTDEERASGRYDNTPPDYERAWGSGTPHSHDAEGAAPETESAKEPAPEQPAAPVESPAPPEGGDAPETTREAVRTEAPRRTGPLRRTVPRVATAAAPPGGSIVSSATHSPRPLPEPAADASKGSRPTAKRVPSPPAAVRPERVTDRIRGFASERQHSRVGRAGSRTPDAAALLLALLAFAGLAGGLAVLAARRGGPPVPPATSAFVFVDSMRDDEIEAELQELIAEERARTAGVLSEDSR